MRLFNLFLVTVLSTSLFLSCGETTRSKGADKMKEVMALHDDVMPKMSQVSKLVAELKSLADSTETNPAYSEAIVELQKAHTGMMNWMKDFGSHFTSDEIMKGAALSEKKMQQLLEDEKKMQEVKMQMERSIQQAKELLAK